MVKLFKFIAPYKKSVVAVLLFLFLQVLGTLYIPTLTASIVNNGIVPGNMDYILNTGVLMVLVAALTGVLAITATYLSTSLSAALERDIRNALFKKSQSFSANDFNQFGTASMITRSTSDVIQIQQAFSMLMGMLLPAPLMTVAALFLAFAKDRFLAFVIIGIMALIVIFAAIVSKKAMPLFASLQILMDQINRVLRENIIGVRVVRAFNRVDYERRRMNKTFTDYADTAIRVNKIFALAMPVIMTMMNLCTLLIIWFGGKRVSSGLMQIGDIMALVEYSLLILFYLIMGVMVFMIIPRAQACAARIHEVLDFKPEFADLPLIGQKFERKTKLEFCNVTFRYAGAEEAVLSDISFTTDAGQTTAIIGGTGSGKSTVASLIPRFYDIQSGNILIDGIDIRNLSQSELRDKIGYVPQKAFLFSGTIADNLRHGRKNAALAELRHAAQIAQIDHFISGLAKKYDSPVSQGGSNFSGGQKQRLAIARAIVKKPGIYVFDDSFSALDFKTDAKLREALHHEARDAAVILVAQRISTIMDADQIIVLDNGRIAGIGTHRELMDSCLVYQQIANSQLSKEELA
ncbi:ABC transporter ATP-binding protein [Sporomusa sp.]|uniref:ABC transporter ATP-binding protein n=1 Tax=Sporomusa sp. TaxID=2078658 RepID=UPI002C92E28D|nr:ABC transporter ATP-binding protein [Sporomusa sp.]HWR08529.1 ABC transporter ATP-binding protein [Sporomusa sp.]